MRLTTIYRPAGERGPEPSRDRSLWRAFVAQRVLFLFLLALGACLAAPVESAPSFEPMCADTADCDSGETCEIGICWGNPPSRTFAAMLLPPVDGRPDLAPTEIVELAIDNAGNVGNLSFAESALVSGRVVLDCGLNPSFECDPTRSIAARITFSRPSRIPGQPAYTRSANSVIGREAGESSFSVALPLSEVEYQVTVLPTGSSSTTGNPTEDPLALAPPSHRVLIADRDMHVEWRLGAPETHKVISGRVVDLLEQGIPSMRVFALESDALASPDERISSIMCTGEDGGFSLRLPLYHEQPFDLIAMPVDDGSTPALRVFGRSAPATEPADIGLMVMPGYGQAVSYTVPVRGIDGNGDAIPIGGATVRVTTLLSDAPEDTVATFSTLGYTDELGNAVLQLLPPGNMQNRTYLADIEPLGGSQHAIRHGHELDVGTDAGGVLEAIRLDRRLAVSGQVFTAAGQPAVASTVEARLSEAFRQSLGDDERALVDGLLLPSTTTDQSGRFVLWLDEILSDTEAIYDLRFLQADPLAPQWSVRGVRMGQQTQFATVEIGTIALPSASYARGTVRDLQGAPVVGAELRWFELQEDADTCGAATGQPCASVFRGLSDTDGDGWVMLVLPE
jgi:hypothetical protein